jgi:Ca2+-binding RTX toxin-like protein
MRIHAVAAGALVAAVLALPAAADAGPVSPASARVASCHGRPVTILGTEGADNIKGSNQRDVILALGGDDRIDGRGGKDVICGGSGRDLIKGGPGADKIFAGADGRSSKRGDNGVRLMVGDVVQGGPGDDLIDLGFDERQKTFGSVQRDRLSYKDSRFRVLVTLGGPQGRGHAQGDGQDTLVAHPFLTLLGSDKSDGLTGSPYGDQILGRGGDDTIDGGGGRDVLVDGPVGSRVGDDVLIGGIGRDTLTSYGGHDRLEGGFSADALTVEHAPLGKVSVQGGPGGDTLTVDAMQRGSCVNAVGGDGPDELVPTLTGAASDAKVDIDLKEGGFGVRVRNRACGFVDSIEALTLVNASAGDGPRWVVSGTSADETVVLEQGGSVLASMAGGDDQVVGSSGDDNLKGGPGDDRLFGDGGHDVANGGPGTDTCRKVEYKTRCEVPAG